MTKIFDISQFRSRKSPKAPMVRNPGASLWKEPGEDASPEALRGLPDEEMAAILVKGMFAIYHLSREHAKLSRKVPDYLYAYALTFEEPIVPTAETLYAQYFHDGVPFHAGDDIPDDLYELGMGTAANADASIHHALVLHRFLTAFIDDVPQAERICAWLFRATTQRRRSRMLLPLFDACRQYGMNRRHLDPI